MNEGTVNEETRVRECPKCKGVGKLKDQREQNIAAEAERDAQPKPAPAPASKPRLAKSMNTKPTAPKQQCRHPALHFEAGGLYVVCDACSQAWQAMNKERLVPDFMARGWGLAEQDKRCDPLL